jgi:hypothetical protein
MEDAMHFEETWGITREQFKREQEPIQFRECDCCGQLIPLDQYEEHWKECRGGEGE